MPVPTPPTVCPSRIDEFRRLRRDWRNCRRCSLATHRTQVVHVRGWLPAPVLFVGEAPGESEDSLGLPFVGDAGSVLDDWLVAAELTRYCLMNIVGCFSCDENRRVKPPDAAAAKACAPRLRKLIELCDPKLIVLVGQTSHANLDHALKNHPHQTTPRLRILHPAAVLRMGSSHEQAIASKRAILTLRKHTEITEV
jgi:uracil-DNA glycosylase